MSSGWIGVDLDQTLAQYDKWRGPTHIGEPIPLMVNRVKDWLKAGQEVRVFTARMSTPNLFEARDIEKAIGDWTEMHIGERLKATCVKDFSMWMLWDDRAVQVEPNTGVRIGSASVKEQP